MAGLFLFQACNKDNISTDEELLSLRERGTLLEGKGHFIDGIICFNSVESFYELKDLLEEYSKDSIKVNEAYRELGYDTLFEKDVHITCFPVLEKFEKSLNFISARKFEETKFYNFLNQRNEPEDFAKHWINDPFLKALLNQNNEIKIGSRYIKHFDNENILIVGNNDLNTFNRLKNLEVVNIKSEYNARILKASEISIKDYFLFNQQGKKIGHTPIKKVDFEVIQINDSTFSFKNNSLIDYGDTPFTPEFRWIFSDGHIYTGFTPPNYTLKTAYVNLKLEATGRDNDIIEGTKVEKIASCYESFVANILPNGVVTYTSNFDFGPNAFYFWDFGDGTSGTGASFTHTYTETGKFTITGTVVNKYGEIISLRCILTSQIICANCCQIPIDANSISIDGGNVMFNIYSISGIYGATHVGIKWGDPYNIEYSYYPSYTFAYYNYKKSGTYKIEVIFYNAQGEAYCWGEITVSVIICNEQNEDFEDITQTIEGRQYKLHCYIWVTKATPYQSYTAGSYSSTYRKGTLTGVWYQHKVDKIWVGNGGYYFEKTYTGTPPKYKCVKRDINYDEPWELNSNFVGSEYEGDNYKEPYKFWSTHRAKIKGVELSYPGKFYLP